MNIVPLSEISLFLTPTEREKYWLYNLSQDYPILNRSNYFIKPDDETTLYVNIDPYHFHNMTKSLLNDRKIKIINGKLTLILKKKYLQRTIVLCGYRGGLIDISRISDEAVTFNKWNDEAFFLSCL